MELQVGELHGRVLHSGYPDTFEGVSSYQVQFTTLNPFQFTLYTLEQENSWNNDMNTNLHGHKEQLSYEC